MSENTSQSDSGRREQVEKLLEEYGGWMHVVDRGGDDFDLSVKAVALYRFAIANQDREGADLLNEALSVFENARSEP